MNYLFGQKNGFPKKANKGDFMKKIISLIIVFACMLLLVGCYTKTESIKIIIPAGSQGDFIYSDAELSPQKSRIEIKSIDMPNDAKFVLKPINETKENTYECTNFPKGQPLLIEAEKGEWYKIGISLQNSTDEDIVIVLHIENIKTRNK